MRVIVNGEPRDVAEEITLEGLIRQLQLAPERLAIERNREVVRRRDWPSTTLAEDDRIEIIHFVGGGCGNASPPKAQRIELYLSRCARCGALCVFGGESTFQVALRCMRAKFAAPALEAFFTAGSGVKSHQKQCSGS